MAEGELIVHFKPKKTDSAKRKKSLNKINSDASESIVHSGSAPDPDVEAAEPNIIPKAFLTPNDPLYLTGATEDYQGVSKFMQQWPVNKTALPQAWDITTSKSTVLIGICDDGIDSTHEDLTAKIAKQYDPEKHGNGRFIGAILNDFIVNDWS